MIGGDGAGVGIVVVAEVLGAGRSSIGSTIGVVSPNAPAATRTSANPMRADTANASRTPTVRRREDRDMPEEIVSVEPVAWMRTT